VQAIGSDNSQYFGFVTCTNGIYTGYIRTIIPQIYTISVTLFNNVVPSNFSANFTQGSLSTKYTIAFGRGVSKTAGNIAGTTTVFYIQSYNQYNVPIATQSICRDPSLWTVSITPAISVYTSNLKINVGLCARGQYQVTFNATTALKYYTVVISYNKTQLSNTYQTQILPDVMDLNQTIVSGLNFNASNPSGDNGTFYIQTRDKWGNNEFTANATDFNVTLSPICANTTVNKSIDSAGRLQCNYTVAEGGIYCVSVTYKQNITITITNSTIFATDGKACSGGCNRQGFCFRTVSPSTSDNAYSCNCFQGYTGEQCEDLISSVYPLSIGAIIGLVVGIGIALLIIGILIGFFCLRRFRRGEDNRPLID